MTTSFFGLGQSADIEILVDLTPHQKQVLANQSSESKSSSVRLTELCLVAEDGSALPPPLVYYDGDHVTGKVILHLKSGKLEHQGIRIELLGQIEIYYERGSHYEFLSLCRDLARPGILSQTKTVSYPFEFLNVQKPYETYIGSNVKLRYFLRVTVVRRLQDLSAERDLLVHALYHYPSTECPLKMEVGIEDCLHIEFQYNKTRYHLKDVILGKIYFLLVRVKIQYMELQIIRRECTGQQSCTESETVARYELMDGAPVRGECIPIRLFLQSYAPFLTPTMRDVYKKFSVRYCLNLVLVDEEDRRYFKQQEIILYRKSEKFHRPVATPETVAALMRQAAQSEVPPADARGSDMSTGGEGAAAPSLNAAAHPFSAAGSGKESASENSSHRQTQRYETSDHADRNDATSAVAVQPRVDADGLLLSDEEEGGDAEGQSQEDH